MNKNDVHPDHLGKLAIQKYGKGAVIEGVKLLPVKYMVDDGGDFCEVVRMNHEGLYGLEDFKPKQVSYSYLQPGTVKAFHMHYKQTDVWFVPPRGQLLVGLYDVRKDSKTAKQTMRLVMGGGKAELLVIPPGVAHGMANIWGQGACVFYLADEHFDAKEPDEQRLPWDMLGKDFWEARRE